MDGNVSEAWRERHRKSSQGFVVRFGVKMKSMAVAPLQNVPSVRVATASGAVTNSTSSQVASAVWGVSIRAYPERTQSLQAGRLVTIRAAADDNGEGFGTLVIPTHVCEIPAMGAPLSFSPRFFKPGKTQNNPHELTTA